MAVGPLQILAPTTTGYFKCWLYSAIAYFSVGFQRGQRLFWRTRICGHGLYSLFTCLSHSGDTRPWQISNTRPKIISAGGFNGAVDKIVKSSSVSKVQTVWRIWIPQNQWSCCHQNGTRSWRASLESRYLLLCFCFVLLRFEKGFIVLTHKWRKLKCPKV